MRKLVFLMMIVFGLSACSDVENRFSMAHSCNFVFRGDYHPGSALLRTVDNPGLYAIVTSSVRSGITHLDITLNDGFTKEDIPLTTAVETHYNYAAMGVNRSLIIGCSFADGIKAWDAHCRYCVEVSNLNDAPLRWTDNHLGVACSRCKRTYTLETGSSNDGYRLYEYRARFDGSVITVSNK